MLGIEIMKRLGGSSLSGIVLADVYLSGKTECIWTLDNDGFTYREKNGGARNQSFPWLNPQMGMSGYAVRATQISGDVPDGTLGAWLNLGTDRSWGLGSDAGVLDCTLTIEIRRVSDSVVVKTITLHLFVSGPLGGTE